MKLSSHPRFHACPTRNLRRLKALSPPFAQRETQPTTAFSVAGCATGSARLLSAHNWGGLLSLYFGLFLYQVHIVATVAGVSRRFAFVELLRIHLPRTPVNKAKEDNRQNYILSPLEECSVLSVRSPRNQPHERGRSHVRQPNLQGGHRLLRCGWRYRVARYLLLGRDRRVAISAVWASTNLLCDVHNRVLLVDGVRAGTRPVKVLRT